MRLCELRKSHGNSMAKMSFYSSALGEVTAQRSLDSRKLFLCAHHKLLDMNATRVYILRRCARRKKTSSSLVRQCESDSSADMRCFFERGCTAHRGRKMHPKCRARECDGSRSVRCGA